jgi:hypothetical protein
MQAAGVRTYISEKRPAGKRHWAGKEEQQQLVYANRQRLQRPKGRRPLRKRGELIERTFAHCYDTGGMRRTHLRKQNNTTADPCGGSRTRIAVEESVRNWAALMACAPEPEKWQSVGATVTYRQTVPSSYHPAACSHFSHSGIQTRILTPDC